jgi:hypothetical protein
LIRIGKSVAGAFLVAAVPEMSGAAADRATAQRFRAGFSNWI